MKVDSQKLEDLFAQAILLSFDERSGFVERACGEDDNLARQVYELLAGHERNEQSDFLERTPFSQPESKDDVAQIAEKEGDYIGRYRLLEKIGEGGMGVVYMAEQTEGVRRRVALKIIKLGMDTRQVIARFEAERQAMAMFDHPNITRVFDAGSTSTGRPYFVMELVKGTGIIDYVRSHDLNWIQQLKLFSDVCNAIQHAHQKGIIHRDLKPSNIMVTLYDGVPVPKVIDFGIAKAIGHQRLTEKTLFTRYSAMVGTPQYMSPEQAEMNGLDVDTRSDIYSLGVLLYELVTGTTPVSADRLKQLNPLAIYETLRDVEIETPSSRLSRTQKETKSTDGETMTREFPASRKFGNEIENLKGELDWIVMKALSRDRSLRYASAKEMADDVERYLKGDPVSAAPPSLGYQLKTLFRKHRTAVMTTGLISALILGSAIACFVFAFKAKKANDQLSIANADLVQNVEQLEQAEAKIRDASESQLYESAIKIALLKFDRQFSDEIDDFIEELYPGYHYPQPVAGGDGAEVVYAFQLCYDYDQKLLTKIANRAMFENTLSRIDSKISKEKDLLSRAFEKQNSSLRKPDALHEHNPECFRLQKYTNRNIGRFRHLFFRHLLAEYRRSFGNDSPNVAAAINLLADVLIDSNQFEEADERLQESLAIASGDDVMHAMKLLTKLEKAKAHRSKMKR